MNPHRASALTLTEVLVCLAIVGVLLFLAIPPVSTGLSRGPMTQTFSNMKQLHVATVQMALDGETTDDHSRGWPGDTGGTFSHWARSLVTNGYLSTNELCKLLSAPGVVVKPGKIPTMAEGAVLVYAVSKNSVKDSVFLTSANFTNTPSGALPPAKKAKTYGDKGFVVFRKGGDGTILVPRQAGQTNIIGSYVPLCE